MWILKGAAVKISVRRLLQSTKKGPFILARPQDLKTNEPPYPFN